MKTRVVYGLSVVALCALLAACGRLDFFGEEREAWRDAAEARCLQAGELQPSPFAEPMPAIRQKGVCGLEHPFKIAALSQGQVSIQPPAKLGCPMNTALNKWLNEVVQPAAYQNYGQPVVGIKNIASYGCRTRNNKHGEKLSEHAFGNALDIKGFYLADGRMIDVRTSWRGAPNDAAFLRQAISGACGTFHTALGPGADYHEDHFHLDLARHGTGRPYCNPRPQSVPTPPPQYYPPQPQSDPYYYPPQISQQPAPQNPPVYRGHDPYEYNTPMSYSTEPHWPIARVPTPYTSSVSAPSH
jgi:hypothetical protein